MEKIVKKNIFNAILKIVLTYIIASLFFIFIFALILTSLDINSKAIWWIEQIVKIISLFIAVFLGVKESDGLLKGVLSGIFGGIALYILFLILGLTTFSFKSLICEIIFLAIVGGIFGVLTVNIKRR